MSFKRPGSTCWRVATLRALIALSLVALIGSAHSARAQAATSDAGWRNVSLAEYQQHLEQLDGVVADCQTQRSLKSPPPANDNACDPARVGPDDRVQLPGDAQPREVRYDWLRTVLAQAANKPVPQQSGAIRLGAGAKAAPPPVDPLLAEARVRLQNDEKQAASPATAEPNYAAQRQTLNGILSQRAYQSASEVSNTERFREWLYNQLDKFLASLVRFGARSPWIGWTLLGLLLLGIGAGLVWAFVRIERNARIKLIPDDMAPAPGTPSAREWQLWLADAQAMAAKGEWRDAIHLVYWSAIARLESNTGSGRLWPADRARTPREYLGLVPGVDARKPALAALTKSFERTWYGGRAAEPDDFQSAMELAASLGVKAK
jgi:hypothetical protein